MSSEDEIRQKRLKRLEALAQAQPREPEVGGQSEAKSDKGNEAAPVRSSGAASVATTASSSAGSTSALATGPSSVSSGGTSGPTEKPNASVVAPKPAVSFEQWEDKSISDALLVSLDPLAGDKDVVYLQGPSEELREEAGTADTPLLSVDQLDRVLWYRLTETQCSPAPFDYLWSSWTRAKSMRKLVKIKDPQQTQKLAVLDSIQSFCQRYAVLITSTDMVSESTPSQTPQRLIAKAYSGSGPWEFLVSAIESAVADEMVVEFVNPIITYLSASLRDIGYSGDYKSYLLALETLTSSKAVCAVFSQLEGFEVPEGAIAKTVASQTLLGPFLSLSPLDPSTRGKTFPTPDILNPRDIQRYSSDISAEYHVVLQRLFEVFNRIIRGSAESRQAVLKYFGAIVDMNHKRTAIQVAPDQVSPDSLIFNITHVLLRLAEPFTDIYGTKMNKIDLEYFRHKDSVVDINEETKINADRDVSKQYFADEIESDSNFITHVFFLASAYVHYGNGGLIQSQTTLKRLVEDHKDKLVRLEAELSRWSGTGHENTVRNVLAKLKEYTADLKSSKLTVDSVLYDTVQQKLVLNFVLFQFQFLIRVAEPTHTFPVRGEHLKLPFPVDAEPQALRNYPEYLIEAGINYVLFLLRYMPNEILRTPYDKLLVFCVAFLTNTTYIKNPYLKSKLVEILFFGSLETMSGENGFLVNLFDTDPVSLEHLMHALMNFYIEVEQTGTSSQFYDKFNTRHYISRVIKVIWANNRYRQKLEKESKEDPNFFVQFVALLMNDATYLFDESLAKLAEIHRLQRQTADGTTDEEESENEEEGNRQQRLESAERQATSYMQLTNESVNLLRLFTSAIPKAFVTTEIVDRLAAMMNYNLAALVGPKCGDLKVQNPEKYFFNPRELLSVLCEVYINLRNEEQFLRAVARDGRSFDPKNFDRAQSILSRWSLKTPAQLEMLKKLVERTVEIKTEDEAGELELGEIPDEFLDPLMYTLMEEPVILPSSKVSIDLSTIKSHLLNDPKDPFNRAPLKIEEVVPDEELKNKIEAFKRQRRDDYRAAKAAKAAHDESQKMDLS